MRLKSMVKCLALLMLGATFSTFALTPVGYWAAQDDASGKVLSVIQIWQATDGTFNGRIYKIMDVTVDGKAQSPIDRCDKCTGGLANQPMLCMQILYGMKAADNDNNMWDGGQAYDPKADKSYHAKMWLSDQGKTLNLRGYIMMPLLGRTQQWSRVDEPTKSNWVCSRSVADSYHL